MNNERDEAKRIRDEILVSINPSVQTNLIDTLETYGFSDLLVEVVERVMDPDVKKAASGAIERIRRR